jgi:hypothetical protein
LPSPTPALQVGVDELIVYEGPGEVYPQRGTLSRGDRVTLLARSEDQSWWQIDYLGRPGWVRAHPIGTDADPAALPFVASPPTPTPATEATPAEALARSAPVVLQNGSFEGIQDQVIPYWWWSAFDNYDPDDPYDAERSYERPTVKQADDPARVINGPTLQIDTTGHPKFRAFVYQTASVPPTSALQLYVSARGFSTVGDIWVKVGIEPDGRFGCESAQWGEQISINEASGIVRLTSPQVVASKAARVTVCLFAETAYASPNQAAFFDDATLILNTQ